MNEAPGRGDLSRRRLLGGTAAISLGWLAGCVGSGGNAGGTSGTDEAMASSDETENANVEGDQSMQEEPTGGDSAADAEMGAGEEMSWQSRQLTDVLTGDSFTISGLAGPVVIQSFAVWCSNCQRQSEELVGLDASITRVGLNIDPNEDAAKVKQHAERNEFDWRFAVAPTEMTRSLIDEFGPTVTNAPSTPIIVVCDDGSTTFFSGSHQSVETLQAAAGEC